MSAPRLLGHSNLRQTRQFRIYRWVSYLLGLSDLSEPMFPLYWQVFFSMYFSHVSSGAGTSSSGAGTSYFGYKFLATVKDGMSGLTNKLVLLIEFHDEAMREYSSCASDAGAPVYSPRDIRELEVDPVLGEVRSDIPTCVLYIYIYVYYICFVMV